jgi:hypothetical protein
VNVTCPEPCGKIVALIGGGCFHAGGTMDRYGTCPDDHRLVARYRHTTEGFKLAGVKLSPWKVAP